MSHFKVHILFEFVDGPWGGGNQFLKTLRKYFLQRGLYQNNMEKANVILFNSHHKIEEALRIKRRYPNKIFIHRVDGPISLVRGKDAWLDKGIFLINALIADGTVFQSDWSRARCFEKGMARSKYETCIFNAPDPEIFYRKSCRSLSSRKIKIVATSWSANLRKGFDIYRYLDERLDFRKYEMTFIGNSPVKFRNIRHIGPLPSNLLAEELRRHDIFITASLNDPCSNSLVEALHCGLPAVVRNSGGHPEIVGEAGVVFNGEHDVCEAIEKVTNNYGEFCRRLNPIGIEEVGNKYHAFIEKICSDATDGKYIVKQLSSVAASKLLAYREFYNLCRMLSRLFTI